MVKKTFLNIAFLSLCSMFALSLTSCDDDDDQGILCNPKKVEIVEGASADVKLSGGTEAYTAKSSDEKVATVKVDKSTLSIMGVKAGKTNILITDAKKQTATLAVTVKGTPLEFDKSTVSVATGKTDVVTVKSGTAPYAAVSANTKIATATVSDKQVTIKGIKAGKTTVTIYDKDKKTGTVIVTVK